MKPTIDERIFTMGLPAGLSVLALYPIWTGHDPLSRKIVLSLSIAALIWIATLGVIVVIARLYDILSPAGRAERQAEVERWQRDYAVIKDHPDIGKKFPIELVKKIIDEYHLEGVRKTADDKLFNDIRLELMGADGTVTDSDSIGQIIAIYRDKGGVA